jgi:hypothetical protein
MIVCAVLCRQARMELAQLTLKSDLQVPWGLWGKGPADSSTDEHCWSNWSVSGLLRRAEAASRLQCACLKAVEHLQALALIYRRHNEQHMVSACLIQRVFRGHFVRKRGLISEIILLQDMTDTV